MARSSRPVWRALIAGAALLAACDRPLPEPFSTCSTADGDPFEVDGVSITGDVLTVDVGYGGGCEDHDFVVCWPEPAFMESDPVQARLELYHDAHDDTCDAFLTEARTFDLTPLRDAWIDAYGGPSGTIVVHVGAFTAEYDF